MFSNSFGALVLDFGNGFDFGNDLGFRQWFGISAMVWNFGNGLGFRQWFGISAMVWDFGNIWDFGNNTYSENEIKSLAEFYSRIKGNGSNIICKPVLNRNTLIREWRIACNIICDYKDFQFIEITLLRHVSVSNGVVEHVFLIKI
ncbi:unnamed protein product [Rhizophagus irregularis]|nr:unnamed protein product [Rhizophagus irregularis]